MALQAALGDSFSSCATDKRSTWLVNMERFSVRVSAGRRYELLHVSLSVTELSHRVPRESHWSRVSSVGPMALCADVSVFSSENAETGQGLARLAHVEPIWAVQKESHTSKPVVEYY